MKSCSRACEPAVMTEKLSLEKTWQGFDNRAGFGSASVTRRGALLSRLCAGRLRWSVRYLRSGIRRQLTLPEISGRYDDQ